MCAPCASTLRVHVSVCACVCGVHPSSQVGADTDGAAGLGWTGDTEDTDLMPFDSRLQEAIMGTYCDTHRHTQIKQGIHTVLVHMLSAHDLVQCASSGTIVGDVMTRSRVPP